ncbi:TetR/AcrR family transcriptional regulator [Nocardia sp. KC 131]|uniref:TetR/AcrR family transcriptional regulator n=1 Tax=Nocardia arseniciresistens TaxID=3392119 RepID=UPI00398E43FE
MTPAQARVEALMSSRRLRADTERNLHRIFAATHGLLSDRGSAFSLDEVARHAGVGVGTVYRQFANKQELITTMFERYLVDFAGEAVDAARDPVPWQGLIRLLEYGGENVVTNCGFGEMLRAACGDSTLFPYFRDEIIPAVSQLLARAHSNAALRPGIDVGDIFAIMTGLESAVPVIRPLDSLGWRRHLTLVLDGIRADTAARIPIADPSDK